MMFCKSCGNAYKWQCSIYLDLGAEMLVKVFEGLIFVPFVQGTKSAPRLLLHGWGQLHFSLQNLSEPSCAFLTSPILTLCINLFNFALGSLDQS